MATEIMKGYSDLQQELDRARNNLKGLNENIRRIIGRDPSGAEQYNNARGGGGGGAGGANGGNGNNNVSRESFDTRKRGALGFEMSNVPGQRREQERRYSDIGQNSAKRRAMGETKSVFSRLSGPPNRDTEYEKPRVFSRVIKEQPSKEDIVAAQGSDERSRARNRRIFGSLLGTLQKFSQEESKLKSKEEKKALIEKKVEEQEKMERENMRKEKQCLFIGRKRQQLEIRALEAKMAKLKDLEMWENSKRPLRNFIKTKANPAILFLPKRMNAAMETKLKDWQEEHQLMMDQKRQEVTESIEMVEARFQADIKIVEENGSKGRNNSGFERSNVDSSKESGNLGDAVGSGRGTKHDRLEMEEEEDDEDQHNSCHYEHEDQPDIAEGPALPASMATRFKITIQNTDNKHDAPELHTSSTESNIIRLLPADTVDDRDAAGSVVDDSDSPSSGSQAEGKMGKNIQITFSTQSLDDN